MSTFDYLDSDLYQDFADPEPRDSFDRCQCAYCPCLTETEYGAPCTDCRSGAHQG